MRSKFLFFALMIILPKVVLADVIEFNEDGSVKVYAARDYLAEDRHKGVWKDLTESIYAKRSNKFDKLVSSASEKYGVSENLIHAVIMAESSYNPDALSSKGAGGLMQLMPKTATKYGASDRFVPEDNIIAGTKYLKFLLDRYGGNISLATAAYNAGEGAVDKYGDVPPYPETQAYVEKIASLLESR